MGLATEFYQQYLAAQNPGSSIGGEHHAPLGLQVLFDRPVELHSDHLEQLICNFHPELREAQVQLSEDPAGPAAYSYWVAWQDHRMRLVYFEIPLSGESIEPCIRPAHYSETLKESARNHQSSIFLYYEGTTPSLLEQYILLAAVAAALEPLGALVVLNECANTSVPMKTLCPDVPAEGRMDVLRKLPIPLLYCGFLKFQMDNGQGYWMRTYGAHRLGVPDLAAMAPSRDYSTQLFKSFSMMLQLLLSDQQSPQMRRTIRFASDLFLRLREPLETESFLRGPGEVLVLERVVKSKSNQKEVAGSVPPEEPPA